MMLQLLQIASILIVAVAMSLSLAHVLELPGKMRLPKETYLQVQQIYYPGFTIGGAAEPIGLLTLLLLAVVTRFHHVALWLTSGAFWLCC